MCAEILNSYQLNQHISTRDKCTYKQRRHMPLIVLSLKKLILGQFHFHPTKC